MRVPAVCASPKTLETTAAQHGVLRPPRYWAHESRRHITRITPPIPGLWLPYTHADCVCNEIISAANRVLGTVPLPTKRGLRLVAAERRRLLRGRPMLVPWTLERTLASFTGARQKRYQEAYESLKRDPLSPRDALISAFVKAEKADPLAKKNPDPRMIQSRQPRYNLVLASYLRAVEHRIYNLRGASRLRMVAKGLNQRARAALLSEKMAMFKSPVVVSLDASRFDKHVSKTMLQQEHQYYLDCFAEYPELVWLLKQQLRNKCHTKNGVKYSVDGGRMSGDINTALGNCLIMVMMVSAALRQLDIQSELLDDGDDCLLIFEQSHLIRVIAELPAIFLTFGQELKIENIARDIHEVVFCQSRVILDNKGYLFVRDWRKVLSHACAGTKYWHMPNMVRPMMGLVGTCELAMSRGVPILQAFALALIRNSRGKMAKLTTLDPGVLIRLKTEAGTVDEALNTKAESVSVEAREAFERAFNTPVWEQLAVEEILNHWDVNNLVATTYPSELDHRWQHEVSLPNVLPEIY